MMIDPYPLKLVGHLSIMTLWTYVQYIKFIRII